MKMIAGSINILAASILIAPNIGNLSRLYPALYFAAPIGIVGVALLMVGIIQDNRSRMD